ncbi:MAG: hypothetical protein JNK19_09760 [Tabrizicola sp.]|nr:hypothetical protein [Tabrizicola sp.]
MRASKASVVLLGTLLCVACTEQERESAPDVEIPTELDVERAVAACRASGREPVVEFQSGLLALKRGLPICDKRTSDGGKACSDSSQCETVCLPTTNTCAAGYIEAVPSDDDNLDFYATGSRHTEE